MRTKGSLLLSLAFLGAAFLPALADATPITITDEITFGESEGHVWGFMHYGNRLNYYHPYDYPNPSSLFDLDNLVSGTLTITTTDNPDNGFGDRTWAWVLTNGEWLGSLTPFGSQLFDVDISQIADNNGGLLVTVGTCLGDFYVTDSVLELTYDDPPAPTPTPEPATLLLMGSGLVGISVAFRKRKGR